MKWVILISLLDQVGARIARGSCRFNPARSNRSFFPFLHQQLPLHFPRSMVSSKIRVIEHTIPCQSIREYHHAGKRENPSFQLAVKQYIPLNTTPGPDDVTIIAGHANGIPKVWPEIIMSANCVHLLSVNLSQECYEPIWEALLVSTNVKIKAIWIADSSNQGASGILNESELGDDRE